MQILNTPNKNIRRRHVRTNFSSNFATVTDARFLQFIAGSACLVRHIRGQGRLLNRPYSGGGVEYYIFDALVLCCGVIVDTGVIVDRLGKSTFECAEAIENYELQSISTSVSPSSQDRAQVRPLCMLWPRAVPDSLLPIFTLCRGRQGKSAMGIDCLSPVASTPLPTKSGRSTRTVKCVALL